MPLVLAWAQTIHKFQGLQAGRSKTEMTHVLIIDPGNLPFELRCPGILYTAFSRGVDIGDLTDRNYTSSIYFWTSNMCTDRVKRVKTKKDGDICERVLQRDL